MNVRIEFDYEEKYLPTKRHKKERSHLRHGSAEIWIKEKDSITKAAHIRSFRKDEDIFWSDGTFYEKIESADSDEKIEKYVADYLNRKSIPIYYCIPKIGEYPDIWDPEESIATSNDKKEIRNDFLESSKGFMVYDHALYQACKEPVYWVQMSGTYLDINVHIYYTGKKDSGYPYINAKDYWYIEEERAKAEYGSSKEFIDVYYPELFHYGYEDNGKEALETMKKVILDYIDYSFFDEYKSGLSPVYRCSKEIPKFVAYLLRNIADKAIKDYDKRKRPYYMFSIKDIPAYAGEVLEELVEKAEK